MNLFEAMTGTISRMANVTRYSSFPTIQKENVAEHSWWVAFISYLIACDLKEQGWNIDMEDVLSFAMTHDISECVSGDVIRSYKHMNPDVLAAMTAADEQGTVNLAKEFGSVGDGLYDDWAHAKGPSVAGSIVGFADQASVVLYCRIERSLGNSGIDIVLKQLYETWFYKYHDHPQLGVYADQMFPNRVWWDPYRTLEMLKDTFHTHGRPMMAGHSEGQTSLWGGIDGGPDHAIRVPVS